MRPAELFPTELMSIFDYTIQSHRVSVIFSSICNAVHIILISCIGLLKIVYFLYNLGLLIPAEYAIVSLMRVPSDVGGVGLQLRHYSDEK